MRYTTSTTTRQGHVTEAVKVVIVVVATVMACCPCVSHAFLSIPSFLEFGSCAHANLKQNFDPVKYTGLWFDIETVPNEYQHTKKCVTQNYTWTGEVMNVATRGLSVDDEKVRQVALMVPDKARVDPASMVVKAEGVPEAPYQVVATDYRTFSCVYSCLDGYAGFMAEFMWVFSRTPTLPAVKIQYCYDLFADMGVDPEKMVPVVQEEPCPYYEKLSEMLSENELHVTKVMMESGGSVNPQPPIENRPNPTPPASPPITITIARTTITTPTTTPTTTTPSSPAGMNEMQDMTEEKEDQKLMNRNEKATWNAPAPHNSQVAMSSRGTEARQTEEVHNESSPISVFSPFLLLLLLTLLGLLQNHIRRF